MTLTPEVPTFGFHNRKECWNKTWGRRLESIEIVSLLILCSKTLGILLPCPSFCFPRQGSAPGLEPIDSPSDRGLQDTGSVWQMAFFSVTLWSWRGRAPFSAKSLKSLWTTQKLYKISWISFDPGEQPHVCLLSSPQMCDLFCSQPSHPASLLHARGSLSNTRLLQFLTQPKAISLIFPLPLS